MIMQESPLHIYLAIAERWLASSSTFINLAREKTVEKESIMKLMINLEKCR